VVDVRRSPAASRPTGLLIAAILEAWTAGYAAVTAPSTLGNYRRLFAGFGAELSGSSKALLELPYLWYPFALTAVALLVWVGVRAQPTDVERRRMKRALWIFGVVFGLSIAWAAVALYVPVFKLGAVV
jgi:hypothetical protein